MSLSKKLSVMTVGLAILSLLATGLTAFILFYQLERDRLLAALGGDTYAATLEHGRAFAQLSDVQTQAALVLNERAQAWLGRSDLDAYYETVFPMAEDGTRRSAAFLYQGPEPTGIGKFESIGAFIPAAPDRSREDRATLLAALDTVHQFGTAFEFAYRNFYYFTPQNELVVYGPDRPDRLSYYRLEAPADWSFQDRSFAQVVSPENNPTRQMACTGVTSLASDVTGRALTTGCHSPVDRNGIHLGSFGVSFLMDGWLRDAVTASPDDPGTVMILSEDGSIIAHPDLMTTETTEALLAEMSAKMGVSDLLAQIKDTGGMKGVFKLAPQDVYVAFAQFQGPNWSYVRTVPIEYVSWRAAAKASRVLLIGLLVLIPIILIAGVAVKKTIGVPLDRLIMRSRLTDGTSHRAELRDLTKREDEIGQLAEAFVAHDQRYRDLLSQLEQKVAERTAAAKVAQEKAETANNAKSAFLANVSHEIRTPLNGVLGMAQALERTELSERQEKFVSVIRAAGDSLLGVINSVLDISKIESDVIELECIRFDVSEMMAQLVSLHRPLANEKNLALAYESNLPPTLEVCGDPVRLQQIFNNLLSNAIKFTKEGSVSLTAELLPSEDNTDAELKINVTDTGIGIPTDALPELFEPFTQADASVTRQFGGTGLGLAIAKELVHAMHGEIDAESTVGVGTTFTVRLRLQTTVSQPCNSVTADHGHNHSSLPIESSKGTEELA